MSNETSNFLQQITDAVFDNIDRLLPEFEFKRYRRGEWLSPYGINGTGDKHSDSKLSIKKLSGSGVLWVYDWRDGGSGLYFFDWYGRQRGTGDDWFRTACNCGKELNIIPPADVRSTILQEYERIKQHKSESDKIEQIVSDCQKRLRVAPEKMDSDARTVYDYLTGVRGYSHEKVTSVQMGFGVFRQSDADALSKIATDPETHKPKYSIQFTKYDDPEKRFPLLIVQRYAGEIVGLKLRSIEPTKADPKNKDKYRNLKGFKKSLLFYGYNDFDDGGSVIVVEGEIDALSVKYAGFKNVVCLGGHDTPDADPNAVEYDGFLNLSKMQPKDNRVAQLRTIIKNHELTSVRLLLDADPIDETKFTTREQQVAERERLNNIVSKNAEHLSNILGGKIPVYVCQIPLYNGGKQDPDEMFTREGDRAFGIFRSWVDDNALSLPVWETKRYFDLYREKLTDSGRGSLNEPERVELRSLLLKHAFKVADTDQRENILNEWNKNAEWIGASSATLEKQSDEQRIQQARERASVQSRDLLQRGIDAITNGTDPTSVFTTIAENAKQFSTADQISRGQLLTTPPTRQQIFDDDIKQGAGIITPFILRTGKDTNDAVQWVLPSSALTTIGAPTSHGKTRILQNLILITAQQCNVGECVLYYSFEETARNCRMKLFNIWSNTDYSFNNISAIRDYNANGRNVDGAGMFVSETAKNQYIADYEKFLNENIFNGQILIFPEQVDASQVVKDIQSIQASGKIIRGVFIDYVQKMFDAQFNGLSRDERINNIMAMFDRNFNDAPFPVVFASQMNRDGVTPSTLSLDKMAEGAGIERFSDSASVIWDSKKEVPTDKKGNEIFGNSQNNAFLQRLRDSYGIDCRNGNEPDDNKTTDNAPLYYTIGEKGFQYILQPKNRNGESGGRNIFRYEPTTGRLYGNINEYFADGDDNSEKRNVARIRKFKRVNLGQMEKPFTRLDSKGTQQDITFDESNNVPF